jgi:GTPase
VLNDATFRQPPPPVRNRRPKFYYATQASIEPPTFVLFASGSEHVHFSYRRYLENRLRDAFGFGGTPLRLIVRERSRVELEARPRKRLPSSRGTKVRVKGKGKAGGKPH